MLNWSRSLAKAKGQVNTPNQIELVHDSPSKHSNYLLNIMTEYRCSKYLLVAEDASAVMKYSTDQICMCIRLWKGNGSNLDDHHFLKGSDEDELTEFGMQIIRIGEILGGIQTKDPIAFWTSKDREAILRVIIPMAKDTVKLKRKLIRISDGMIMDLTKLRKLADIHGLISGEPDPVQSCPDVSHYNEPSVIELGLSLPVKPDEVKSRCFKSVTQFLHSIFTSQNKSAKESNKGHTSSAVSRNQSSKKISNGEFSLRSMDLKTPSEKPSEKHLQKIASVLATPKNLGSVHFIFDPQEARVKVADPISLESEAETWKVLDRSASRRTKPLKSISPIICNEIGEGELKEIVDQRAKDYFPVKPNTLSTTVNLSYSIEDSEKTQNDLEQQVKKIQSGNHNDDFDQAEKTESAETGPLDAFERQLESIGIAINSPRMSLLTQSASPQEDLSDIDNNIYKSSSEGDKEEQSDSLTLCTSIVDQMHQSVSIIMEQIRIIERFWLTLTMPSNNSQNKSGKFHGFSNLKGLLDFVRKTIHLLEDSDFDKQLYPETRRCLIQALDPVYREVHSCFIALGELVQVVSTDVSYLRELLQNFPKGDPIVYEYSSNSSLGSFDQVANAMDIVDNLIPDYSHNIKFDLDSIFV